MLKRILATVIGIAAVAVLGALASSSVPDRVPDEDANAASESSSAKDNPNCGNANRVQAGDLVADIQNLNYRGYLVHKLHRKVRKDASSEQGPSRTVDVSYAAISRNRKVIARFDAGIYFGLGNSIAMGFFSLLDNGREQLIISQDVPRGGNQWIIDFDQTVRVVFDGQKFEVGREAYDMTISDLDGDRIYEILVPITAFYGFEGVRLAVSDTPLPSIVFKYDVDQKRYLPANPLFKDCLLKYIEAAEKKLRAENEPQEGRARLMSLVLDYVFVGEENRAWMLFDETCKLPDKVQVKAEIQAVLNNHPVYRYIYKKSPILEKESSEVRNVDFENLTYSARPIYPRGTFKLKDGSYPGRSRTTGAGSPWEPYPVSLVATEYGDVTNDGNEEAVVVLTEDVKGTAIPYYIYVYTMEEKRPRLLWSVATGDRAEGGLTKVYAENGELVIELYGKGNRVNGNVFADDGIGACCPLSITRTRYRWKKNHFVQHGKSEVRPYQGGNAPLVMSDLEPN